MSRPCSRATLSHPSSSRKLRVILREVERSALRETDVAEFRAQLQPQPQAAHHQRQLDRRSALLAHPAPVASRLLAGDPPLLEERDAKAFARQEIRGRAADDAAADDRDVDDAGQDVRIAPRPLVGETRVDLLFAGLQNVWAFAGQRTDLFFPRSRIYPVRGLAVRPGLCPSIAAFVTREPAMRLLLTTFGSRGDVQPLLALGVALRALGADARVCAPPDDEFAKMFAAAGVPLLPAFTSVREWIAEMIPEARHDLVAATCSAGDGRSVPGDQCSCAGVRCDGDDRSLFLGRRGAGRRGEAGNPLRACGVLPDVSAFAASAADGISGPPASSRRHRQSGSVGPGRPGDGRRVRPRTQHPSHVGRFAEGRQRARSRPRRAALARSRSGARAVATAGEDRRGPDRRVDSA